MGNGFGDFPPVVTVLLVVMVLTFLACFCGVLVNL